MIRICTSLAENGYHVTLVGRKLPGSIALSNRPFSQKRLKCVFTRNLAGYMEFNLRLFFFLLFFRHHLVCAIDLDTIMPCYFSSAIKATRRIYDAHELFCEMKEIASRPLIHKCWKTIERLFVPRFRYGYTVNEPIAREFHKMYRVNYQVIRNLPLLTRQIEISEKKDKYILYQGAVNEGRCFETLIPAMKYVPVPLVICGDGNFMLQAQQLVKRHGVEDKITFKGKILPEDLNHYTVNAWLGVTLFDRDGQSNYYSLANRFFDYMNAGVPQVCVDYPAYRSIIQDHPFAWLTTDISAEGLAREINYLLRNEELYITLKQECLKARQILNWQEEEKKLITFYRQIQTP